MGNGVVFPQFRFVRSTRLFGDSLVRRGTVLPNVALAAVDHPTSAPVFCADGTSRSDHSCRPNDAQMDHSRRILSCVGSLTVSTSKCTAAALGRTASYFRL